MSTEVRVVCQKTLVWSSYCALLACLQDQTFPFSACVKNRPEITPLRECFNSGAAVQCHLTGALGQHRDLPRSGAL